MAPPNNGGGFAEAAANRVQQLTMIGFDDVGLPPLYVQRLSARQSRKLREQCLRKGFSVDQFNEPGAADTDRYMTLLVLSCCKNEDGSDAFASEDEVASIDEDLLAKIGTRTLEVLHPGATTGAGEGNA